MEFPNVGVIGAGTIGTEVAQCLAQAGHQVVLVDVETGILDRARSAIGENLRYASLFDAEVREASHDGILSRIDFTTDYGRLADIDLVVDNSTESWPIKEEVFTRLDRICPPDRILAANTSAISITRLAGATRRPERVIGVHFMNPVFRKPVVEVVKGWHTSDATVEAVQGFLGGLGKRGLVTNDMPGFVSNRVLMLAINEAISVVHDRVATPADVDEIFVKCLAHEMGPLATADLIGLDTVLRTLDVLNESYGDGRFRACPLLRQMVDAGLRGRKSGKGFFDYSGQQGLRWT